MPKTLDTHLVGVTVDRPHPESYGADVPLRSELAETEQRRHSRDAAYQEGRSDGYARGCSDGTADAEAHATALRQQLARALDENTSLRQQLEAKKSA